MKRCAKCILPETYPGIAFDENGVCNRCKEWGESFTNINYDVLKPELKQLVEKKKTEAREHGSPYDVIVPVSGGKDSAYVLYVMKEFFHCRVLAINYYNTFQTEIAYKNLMSLINTFDVDFRMVSIKPGLLKSAYKAGMEQLGEFCLVCNCSGYWILLSFLSDMFAKYEYTPMIVGGWSRLFEYDPQINTLNFRQYRQLLVDSNLLDDFSAHLRMDVLDSLSGQTDVRQETSGGFIQLPDYMPWSHSDILQTLKSRGWQPMKDKDTHFDCWASPLADKLERAKYGLNQKTTINASYVRAGMLNRDKAIMDEELSLHEPDDKRLMQQFEHHIGIAIQPKNGEHGNRL